MKRLCVWLLATGLFTCAYPAWSAPTATAYAELVTPTEGGTYHTGALWISSASVGFSSRNQAVWLEDGSPNGYEYVAWTMELEYQGGILPGGDTGEAVIQLDGGGMWMRTANGTLNGTMSASCNVPVGSPHTGTAYSSIWSPAQGFQAKTYASTHTFSVVAP